MSTVHFKNGMLLLSGDERPRNEMSFKPTNDRSFSDRMKYWGRVNDFNYSLPWSTVENIAVIANSDDKVWVDNPMGLPVVRAKLATNIPTNPRITLSSWSTEVPIQIRSYEVQAVKKHYDFNAVNDIEEGSMLILSCGNNILVEENWEDVIHDLAAVGWGQPAPTSFVSSTSFFIKD